MTTDESMCMDLGITIVKALHAWKVLVLKARLKVFFVPRGVECNINQGEV